MIENNILNKNQIKKFIVDESIDSSLKSEKVLVQKVNDSPKRFYEQQQLEEIKKALANFFDRCLRIDSDLMKYIVLMFELDLKTVQNLVKQKKSLEPVLS